MSKTKAKSSEKPRHKGSPSTPTNDELSPSIKSSRSAIRWPWIIGLFVVAVTGTYLFVKFFVPMPLPNEVVGTWRVANGELKGSTFHFERDGSFRTQVDGKPVEAVVRFNGTNLQFIWNNPVTGQNEVETQTIKHVDAKELVLQVPSGQSVKLVRMTP